jgi:hypothetical protein
MQNAMPIARDRIMNENIDWRTNQRLRMYEMYAQMKIEEFQNKSE